MRNEGWNVAQGAFGTDTGKVKNNLGTILLLAIIRFLAPISILTRKLLLRIGTLIRPECPHFLKSGRCENSFWDGLVVL
jgi:hypothetical protein